MTPNEDHFDRKERISLIRSRLLAKCPFVGHLCLKLNPIFATMIPTMGVTRDRKLFVNPDFLDKLTDDELEAVIIHETLHCALLCFERQGYRTALVNGGISLWNVAHDYAINLIIEDFGLKLPEGGLLDKKYHNLSAEEIYDLIFDEAEVVPICDNPQPGGSEGEEEGEGAGGGEGEEDEKEGEGEGEGDGEAKGKGKPSEQPGRTGRQIQLPDNAWGHEDLLPDSDMGEGEKAHHDTQWEIAIVEAAQVHQERSKGNLPGSLKKIIKDILDPKVSWVTVLSRWVGENGRRCDFTYSRPSRRSESVGEFLPSLKKHGVDDIVILGDTSGSMNGREKEIAAETWGICEDLGLNLRFLACDTHVREDRIITGVEDLEDAFKGGGGSDFGPAFDLLTDEGYEGVVVAFTDGYIGVPGVKPVHLRDCLWVIGPGDQDPTHGKWGQVLEVDAEGYAI